MKRDRWQDSSDEEEDKTRKKDVAVRKNPEKRSIESSKASTHLNEVIEVGSSSNISKTASPPVPERDPLQSHTKQESIPRVIHPISETEEYNPAIYGCRSVEEYEKISYINQGTYGLVFKARCMRSNDIVALKEIKMTSDTRKVGFPVTALREINILLALRHPNIIRVREMVIGSSLDRVFMVMDYYDFDLKTCMDMSSQSFSTAEVKQLMLQLLSGIHHMHSNWFLHRDLKTSNILYANTGTLCICDFGMARKYGRYVLSEYQ